MNVQFVVEHIRCDATTEEGHDEVYMIIGGSTFDQNNAPTPISARPPNATQGADADPKGENGAFTAWDCNDSGQMQDKHLNTQVFNADVPNGGHVVLSVNLNESDGTKLGDQIEGGTNLANKILEKIPNPIAQGIGKVLQGIGEGLKQIIPRNEDDHLGAIGYTFSNEGGKVLVTDAVYGSGAINLKESAPGVKPYTNLVRFRGDGSDYKITFRIDGATKGALGPTAQGDRMRPGEVLNPGESIRSQDGRDTFVYQNDGNLVLYRSQNALWASNTVGTSLGVCIMQGDGNLVIYDVNKRAVWNSGTWGNLNSNLIVQNDGNVVIYRADNTAIWATNTVVPEERPECTEVSSKIRKIEQSITGLMNERSGLNVRNDRVRLQEISAEILALKKQKTELLSQASALGCPT